MATLAPDLVVDSVTGVDVAVPVAGPGARSFAFLTDWLIRTILAVAWYVVAALLYNRSWSISPSLNPDAAWFVAVIAPPTAIYFLYHPVFEIATRGRTPGKRMAGVQIVTRNGGAPTVGALLARNVFRLVDSFPLAYAVGLWRIDTRARIESRVSQAVGGLEERRRARSKTGPSTDRKRGRRHGNGGRLPHACV